MPQQSSYIRWATNSRIPLTFSLVDPSGAGITGASPTVSIRRVRETYGGILDGYFWEGTGFVPTPTWHPLVEVDLVNNPGVYTYIFDQALVGLENTYLVYFKNPTPPVSFCVEVHQVTNEIYIPHTQPDPLIVGSQTVMGQLEIVKGLLHHNSMVDNQTFDNGQLTSARVRMFDLPNHVPAAPGGSEVLGRLAEFQITSEYDTQGMNKKFVLKRTYP
jgi:hypothetical protein